MTDQGAALAQRFHEAYERLAPSFGFETREASAKPWADVPEQNRALMIAVCDEILVEPDQPEPAGLRGDLRGVLNRYSAENGSNTPDHVLADYVLGCLRAFDFAVRGRADWYRDVVSRQPR